MRIMMEHRLLIEQTSVVVSATGALRMEGVVADCRLQGYWDTSRHTNLTLLISYFDRYTFSTLALLIQTSGSEPRFVGLGRTDNSEDLEAPGMF